jgi:transglutaminase-like putative cysteine protease
MNKVPPWGPVVAPLARLGPSRHPERATALATLALLFASQSLLALIRPGVWLLQTVGLILLVGVVMGLSRRWRSWLPGPLSLVTVGLYVTAACAPHQALLGVLPTPESLAQVGRQLGQAMVAVIEQPPLSEHPEVFTPLVLLAFGLIALITVAVAADLGRPALAGLPIAGPWILVGVMIPDASLSMAALTGVTYLALLAWGGAYRTEGPGAGWPGVVTGVGILIAALAGVGLAVAGPLLPGWGSQEQAWLDILDDLGLEGNGSSGSSVDLGLNLTSALRQDDNVVFLRTVPLPGSDGAIGDGGQRLRLDARYTFDGTGWRGSPWRGNEVEDGQLLWPDLTGVLGSDGDPGPGWSWTTERLQVELVDLAMQDRRVPLTLAPRTLSNLPPAEYNPVTDSVRLADAAPDNWSYVVETRPFVEARLATLSVDSQGAPNWAFGMPDLPHADEIRMLAQEITSGTANDFERLQALADYFHGPDFLYSVDTDYRGSEDPLWDFLQNKAGFCVHYASAMTVMARSLGLPARVAVGFAAGDVVADDGTREVRGSDAHAWPEVYFELAGWVPFEPTPGIPDPLADPDDAEASPTPSPTAEASASSSPSANPSATATAQAEPGPAETASRWWRVAWPYVLSAMAVVAAGLGAWMVHRHRRATATADRIWRQLHSRALRRGLTTPGQSVRATATALGERVDSAAAKAAFQGLADIIEARRYTRPHPDPAATAAADAAARRYRDLIDAAQPFSRRRR